MQRLAPRVARLVLARDLRQRHAGHLRQALDRFRKAHALRFHHEVEDAAVLAGGEIEPGLLLVVHEERRRLLLVERRQALELAARAHELHAPADDLRHRKAGLQLVEKLGREAHGVEPNRSPIIGLRMGTFGAGGGNWVSRPTFHALSCFSTAERCLWTRAHPLLRHALPSEGRRALHAYDPRMHVFTAWRLKRRGWPGQARP